MIVVKKLFPKKNISEEVHCERNLKFRENICAEVSGQRTVLERLFKIFHQGRELILTIFELRVEVENFIKISGCSNLLSFYKLSQYYQNDSVRGLNPLLLNPAKI